VVCSNAHKTRLTQYRFWIVLDQGKLSEYTNWKQKLDLHMDPIDLRVASVREARNAERRFCFEIITPQFTRVYQATSEDDMKAWIATINNALQSAVEGKGVAGLVPHDSSPSSGSIRKDIASVLTGKSASTGHRSGYSSASNKVIGRHATVGDKPSYKPPAPEINESSQRLLKQIREADAANQFCADCGSDQKVEWVSINLGIIICIECGGIHRSLGTHISKVRSLTLDPNAFTLDVIELLLKVGNHIANMVWEARLDTSLKPSPNSNREQRLKFISAKYSERAYVQPISATLSHFATADETLLASIKKNDIQNVIYALALKANPNALDKSRSTHSVFLALAAADPASPSQSASPLASPRTAMSPGLGSPGSAQATTGSRKPFPVAELLLLNGADLPALPAPIPLSASARLYMEGKTDQKNGRKTAYNLTDEGGVGTGGDTLTALPEIRAGNGTSPAERAREREERLRKRVSAGGRLVKQNGPGGGSNFP
jgi:Arf-GAP with SH3 domain, ANK repeat and PH domain-containing protein